MKHFSAVLAVLVLAGLLLLFLRGSTATQANPPGSVPAVRLVSDSNPTPCPPLFPCGMGYHWDGQACNCLPDNPPAPMPKAPLPAKTPTYF